MNKNKFIPLLFLCIFFSCKAQEVRVVVNDETIISDENITVFSIKNKKDTLHLKSYKSEYYRLNNSIDDIKLIVKYKSISYELSDLDERTKFVYIDYVSKAEENCYVLNEMFSDAIQTKGIGNLKNCTDITNIYLYREFESKINKGVKIKRKQQE